MAYASKNPRNETMILTDQSANSISNPASGSHRLINRSGAFYIQNSSGTESQLITGTAGYTYSGKSADYTVLTNDNILVIGMTTSATDRTVTLPAAASSTNRVLHIIKVDSGSGHVIVDGSGSETINGQTTITLYDKYEMISLICTGSTWFTIGNENFDNVVATQRGQKTYFHGTTYNGGAAPTVTSDGALSGFSVVRAAFQPRQMQDGSWWCKGNVVATFTSTTFSSEAFSVNGLTSKNTTNYIQNFSGHTNNYNGSARCQIGASSGSFSVTLLTSTGSTTAVRFNFDIELDSKPTWAY